CQQTYGALDVAREALQTRRFLQIDEDELVEPEVRRQPDLDRHLVRGNFVEITREPVPPSLRVAQHLARLEQRSKLVIQIEGIDDLDRPRFTHTTGRPWCCRRRATPRPPPYLALSPLRIA